MQPAIGITTATTHEDNRQFSRVCSSYAEAVVRGGGVPLLLPVRPSWEAETVSRHLDGLLLSGGDEDIDPCRYGESPCSHLRPPDGMRDEWEIALYSAMTSKHKPVLGICRGCQLINVAAGGTLIQHVDSKTEGFPCHCPEDRDMQRLRHTITLLPGTRVAALFGRDRLQINSLHHQAVKEPAPGFMASAYCDGHVIEAIEARGKVFIVGIQWHPESLVNSHPEFLGPFSALVEAARKAMRRSD